ncbi:hypothetical protein [Streptomyces xanthochromogenes]
MEGILLTQPLLLAADSGWTHDLAQAGIVALIVFGLIALVAVCRARPEDMVRMVEVVGRALAGLVPWSRRNLSAGQPSTAEVLPAQPEPEGGLRTMEEGGSEGNANQGRQA